MKPDACQREWDAGSAAAVKDLGDAQSHLKEDAWEIALARLRRKTANACS